MANIDPRMVKWEEEEPKNPAIEPKMVSWDGGEKKSKSLLERLGVPQPHRTPQQLALMEEASKRGWGTGFPKAVYEIGGNITDTAVKAGASPEVAGGIGYLSNVLLQGLPTFLTSGRIGPTQSLLEAPAKSLLQSAVKPSVNAKDAPAALQTMLRENVYPTAGGMEKVAKITGGIDDMVTQAVTNSPATVNVVSAGSRLREPYQQAMTQVNPQADIAAVRGVWDEFVKSPLVKGKTEIPVKVAHELKRGTYKALGDKVYGELSGAATEAQKALARGLREEVAAKVPEIKPLLERQSQLLNAAEVAAPRAAIEANKNPMGLAGLRLDHPASALASWLDRMAAVKAFLAMQMFGAGKPQLLAPLGEAVGTYQNQGDLYSNP